MIFIDASLYLSILRHNDSNHAKAVTWWKSFPDDVQKMTSQAILGEVLTVGSLRYDRRLTIAFVEKIRAGKTTIMLETPPLVARGWEIFKNVSKKDVSWVDCYSCAIIQAYKIETVLTFDRDLQLLIKLPPT
ncbi:hypothetical protein A2875_01190 [Candidatus Gottesmanbacteria bacterium RIFCSPHIGHO2_01_FULL_46_14]|uniref:PIN domain-containing protein n=2 Tax=Candidatus Gottesmaniibacteriota TaxID=1752720 RepID=A0A1F5ZMD8_9BACT|nr:MAG: hypothetical protein A2875_01190 [Candidatus Gottesmanbacteria bacterium RIFCSPHIGHO2_01_FULL_46_14]OGG28982.1 MAG: hypothetical protein A2971_05025 [Candidatus Gottesmanbacteria bacterium RIFCSPLOWO2_01_FULL_46_21]